MEQKKERPKVTTTKREPLIVRVPTALSLVHDQVRQERKRTKQSDVPPKSRDVEQATG